jgi:Zn-dependent protease/CBS domain-containing protein
MRWAWRVATIAGIPVYVHGTFAVMILFFLMSGLFQGRGVTAALASVAFILAIFATVILHELGHALTARHFGIRTRDITLLPIGGIARLERMPDVSRQELWVALAGPAVNVLIAIVCLALFVGGTGQMPMVTLYPGETGFVGRFTAVNLTLALFNLVPAFPMDGGRVLRALLAEYFNYVRATEIAARIGQGLAVVFGLVGLFVNPWLVFIGVFVWMGAGSEAAATAMRSALVGVPVSRAMMTDFRVVEAHSSLRDTMALALMGGQRDFPVVSESTPQIVGVLSLDQLLSALKLHGPNGVVRDVMAIEFETANAGDSLDTAFSRLQSSSCPVLPVLQDGRLVGLLTGANVKTYAELRGTFE